MRKASLDHIYYEQSVMPSISSIIPNSGYAAGQKIQIKGTGFSNNPSKINVNINGVICDV